MDQDVRRSAEVERVKLFIKSITQQNDRGLIKHLSKRATTLLVAVYCHDVFSFDNSMYQTPSDSSPLPKGTAFPFIKAVQTVNKRLISLKKNETLFEIIMFGQEYEEHIKTKITDSITHYGLEIVNICFCSSEDFIKMLQVNCIKLFLSTDRNSVHGVLQAGVPAALLYKQEDHQVLDQLRVLFSGDLIGLPLDSMNCLKNLEFSDEQIQNFRAAKTCIMEFAALIGEMRRRLGHEGSPLHTSLMTACGSKDVCATALKKLRAWGVDVDEAYCLAGAPHSLILSVLQPHILWDDELQNMKSVPSLMRVSS